ncbi:MAG: ECF transporter S component [Oscillospiraceae bacterium]
MNSKNSVQTKKLVLVALFTAIVAVLQLLGVSIRFGVFAVSLVGVPIVIGAALCGPLAGAWLGLVFGITVLISGDAGLFMAWNPFGTILTVLLKGTLAGLAAGLVYKLLEKKNSFVAVLAAAVVCPVVNTGVFFLGCLAFFLDYCVEYAAGFGITGSGAMVIITFFIGWNFVFELGLDLILSGVIDRLINIGKKTLKKV